MTSTTRPPAPVSLSDHASAPFAHVARTAAAVTPDTSSPSQEMVLVPTETPTDHARRRRRRTAQKLAQLRAQVNAWGHVALALPLVEDADEIWDAFLDDALKRVRGQLRLLRQAAHDTKRLTVENALLKSILKDHRRASHATRRLLVQNRDVDDWELHVQRWKALARIHFRPWTHAQCAAELAVVEQELDRIEAGDHTPDSGLSVLGWTDRVGRQASHVRDALPQLHFSLHKTFLAFDLDHFVATVERIFKDTTLYTAIVHGGRARASVDVLQQLSPHIAVVMYHERYPDVDTTVHMLSLNAQIQRDDGVVTQFYRPIDAHEIMRAFLTSAHDAWMRNFHWARYCILTRHASSGTDYQLTVHGTIHGDDLSLVRYWRFRVLESLVRIEATAARRELLEVASK